MEERNDDFCITDEELLDAINFDVSENQPIVTPTKEGNLTIEVGMEFPNKEKIYELYNSYAFAKGFGLRKRNVRPNYILYTCNREGFNPDSKDMSKIEGSQRKSSICRNGCQAALHAYKQNNSNIWRITRFNDVHNHEMVSPTSVTLLRSHKNYSAAAKSLTESFSRAGVPIAKVPTIFSSCIVPFEARDCYNHLNRIRKVVYEAGDAQGVQLYYNQQQIRDLDFFYSIQFDDDSRMRNFFWIDSRSRHAYEAFGDVITFDTTYRTNKYSMPFAPFVGINNHLQTLLLGCALLHDETEETFVWLFETWLTAMKGKRPNAIITDQDGAIGKAIGRVFPSSRHRLCLWHITKKFPEKISHIYHDHSNFKKEINDCIYKAKSVEYFEEKWSSLIEKYELQENKWLNDLYNIRVKWVPVFNRNTFFAGMSTTQRYESINAFFDEFVHSGTTLQEFVLKFDSALDKRYESYRKEEFDSRHKQRRLVLNISLEEHAASVYTRNVFNRFHDELSAILQFSKAKLAKVGQQSTYRVWDKKDLNDDFLVTLDVGELNVNYTCNEFDFMGILCRHILTIFHAKNIEEIPSQYIMQRWRKDGNKIVNSSGRMLIDSSYCLRSFGLRPKYTELDAIANKSEVAYKFIHDAMDSVIATARGIVNNEGMFHEGFDTQVDSNPSHEEGTSVILKDPIASQTKGRKRIKSGIELSKKNTNICSNCGNRGHNKRGCKLPPKLDP